jgi:hypothetical protein
LFCLDEYGVEAIDDGRGRGWTSVLLCEDSPDRGRSIDRSDRIEDIELRHRGLMIPQRPAEQGEQIGPQEWGITRRYEQPSPMSDPGPAAEPLNGSDSRTTVQDERDPRERRSHRIRRGLICDGDEHFARKRGHGVDDATNHRFPRDILQGFGPAEPGGGATRENEGRVHGDPMEGMPQKTEEER